MSGGNVEDSPKSVPEKKQKPKTNWLKFGLTITGAVVILFLGIGIGNGKIPLGPDSVFRNSVGNNKNLPSKLDFATTNEVYNKLKTSFDGDLDINKLNDGLKQGLARATGDPYTEYFNPAEAKEFDGELNGTFTGIGAELSKDNNAIVVVSPIAGFPAEKAGLRSKDVIVEINGKSAYDLGVSEAVKQIRGPAGTKVKLKVIRGGTEEKNFEITREQISIPSVETKTLEGNIGYIKITRFGDDTAELTQKAASEFKAAGVKGIVLDMRGNPGGLLDASVQVSSLWLPKGKIVLQEKRGGVIVQTFKSDGSSTLVGVPTVVLINEGSASASEITAGALKDNGVATIVGVKSFGKGSVQQLLKLSNGGVLKVTAARWYTPNGKNIDKEGVSPDKEVKITEAQLTAGQDPQLEAALQQVKQ